MHTFASDGGRGPTLIVGLDLFALRGFVFLPAVDRQHSRHPVVHGSRGSPACGPGHWPRGHVPLWNPFHFAGRRRGRPPVGLALPALDGAFSSLSLGSGCAPSSC